MTDFVEGNDIHIYQNGNECLNELMDAFTTAEHHIHIEVMYFANDETTRQIANLLMEKARDRDRNVEVRLLVSFPSSDSQKVRNLHPTDLAVGYLFDDMIEAGVSLINSHPISWAGMDARVLDSIPLDTLFILGPPLPVGIGHIPRAQLVQLKRWLMKRYLRKEKFDPEVVPDDFQNLQQTLDTKLEDDSIIHFDHRKIIVIDGKEAFICCNNIARHYLYEVPFDADLPENFWLDAFAKVRGPVVHQAQKAFAERWMLSAGDVFTTDFTPSQDNSYFPSLQVVGNMRAKIVTSGYESKEDNPIRKIIQEKLADSLNKNIFLLNPFIYDEDLLSSLYGLAEQGNSEVKIITGDHHISPSETHDLGMYYYKNMVDAGIAVCEYPERFAHLKLMTIGTDWATVGSYNWNYRSAVQDLECNLFVISEEFVNEIFDKIINPNLQKIASIPQNLQDLEKPVFGCLNKELYDNLPIELREDMEEIEILTGILKNLEHI